MPKIKTLHQSPWLSYVLLPLLLIIFALQVGFLLSRSTATVPPPPAVRNLPIPTPTPFPSNQSSTTGNISALTGQTNYYLKIYRSEDDLLAATVDTGSTGAFDINLPAGKYYYQTDPQSEKKEFVVYPSVTTKLAITYDSSNRYHCPEVETWLDCLSATNKNLCTADYLKWATRTCSTFKGVSH